MALLDPLDGVKWPKYEEPGSQKLLSSSSVALSRWPCCASSRPFLVIVSLRPSKYNSGTITSTPPFEPDAVRALEKPFHLMTWIKQHMEEIQTSGSKRLWDTTYQSDVVALGEGEDRDVARGDEETWLWQLMGTSTVTIEDVVTKLSPQDSVLVKANAVYSHVRHPLSVCVSVNMPWAAKSRAFKHLLQPAQANGVSKKNGTKENGQ